MLVHLVCVGLAAAQLVVSQVKNLVSDKTVTFVHDFPKNAFNSSSFDVDLNVGQETWVRVNMTNTGIIQKTVVGLSGALTSPDDASVIKTNLTGIPVQKTVKPGKTVVLKYKFTPQLEAGTYGFVLLVDFYDLEESGYKQVGALDTVNLIYADSYYDIQSLFIYFLGAVVVYGLYQWSAEPTSSSVSKPKKKKVVKAEAPPPSDEPDMSWIPDHVVQQQLKTSPKVSPKLKKRK